MIDRNLNGIVIELGKPYLINRISFLNGYFGNEYTYSYFIEVSDDTKSYEKVVDYSAFDCYSWQFLCFSQRAVRYIRIIFTKNISDKRIYLKAMFQPNELPIISDITKPNDNVATILAMAMVYDSIQDKKPEYSFNLLNGRNVESYDAVFGYISVTIKGFILVHLNQPYNIDSMRLLLWDLDDRTYSFYIETSTDNKNWEIAVDKRKERLRSWQKFKFQMRPVVYIKITGTYSSADDVSIDIPKKKIIPIVINLITFLFFCFHWLGIPLCSF